MIRYELHFGDEVLEGTPEELKEFTKGITVYWELFKVYGSDLNDHKYRKLTVTDIREVINLRHKGWTYSGIATKFHCSSTRMNIIIKSLNI
jgi:hypothetical protein